LRSSDGKGARRLPAACRLRHRRSASPRSANQYAGGEGWKQAIIGTASRPGAIAYSCTDLEVVTVNSYCRGFPEMYHSCGVKDGPYEGLEEPSPPSDYFLENGIRNPGCMYHAHPSPPCHAYKPDQWYDDLIISRNRIADPL
jgi:hypothetical protein